MNIDIYLLIKAKNHSNEFGKIPIISKISFFDSLYI